MLTSGCAAAATSAKRVLIADDDVLLREGLASVLERSGYHVVSRCGTAVGLPQLVHQHQPDIVIVDIRMPPTNTTDGLDAARVIRREVPHVAVLVLSAHVEVDQAVELMSGGERCGYLLKSRIADIGGFLETMNRIFGGASVVDPAVVQELIAARRVHDPLQALSCREHEVLALMAEGRSNLGIARQLFVTDGTVEKHVHSILMKLGLPDAADGHRRVMAVLKYLDAH